MEDDDDEKEKKDPLKLSQLFGVIENSLIVDALRLTNFHSILLNPLS